MERRSARFYKRLTDYFPSDTDAVFSIVALEAMANFTALVANHRGTFTLAKSLHDIKAANLPPARQGGWNRTTLQALKMEPGIWTYLQVAYPRPS